ncbi:MAG: flagellar hook-associated protein FlgK [Bryobacteraceae bacterium]
MSSLMSSLQLSANALGAYDDALTVSRNNVSNASTTGYAAQRASLSAMAFDLDQGLIGGVEAGEVQSTRSQYAEKSVRQEESALGYYEQVATSLESLESAFDISEDTGICGALNDLYDSFSAWSVSTDSSTARSAVITSAEGVVNAFQNVVSALDDLTSDTDEQLRNVVSQINEIGARIQSYNAEIRNGAADASSLETQVNNALEELSELVDFDAIYQSDGTVNVLIGGQTGLVVGDSLNEISVSFSASADATYTGATPDAHVLDASGKDVTVQISEGRLGGLLYVRNEVLPSIQGGGTEAGSLNTLAKSIADRINTLLLSGETSDGSSGVALFTYDTTSDVLAARSLAVNESITKDQLAAVDPGPPSVSNGIALSLSGLADPAEAEDQIDGMSYIEYYGSIASYVGSELSSAEDSQTYREETVSQARSLRSEISGVSLDEEALLMTQYQTAYEAMAQVVTILTDLLEVAINMVR